MASVGYGSFDARRGLDACLVKAVKKGHPPIAKSFLAKGADVNAIDDVGSPAIFWAVAGGSVEVVTHLIEAGVDVNRVDSQGIAGREPAETHDLDDVAAALATGGLG